MGEVKPQYVPRKATPAMPNALPNPLRERIRGELLFCAKTDLGSDGRFGGQWMAVTDREVRVWQEDGTQARGLSVTEIKDARAAAGIGGGMLVADANEGPVVLVRYTAEQTPIFGFAAKLLAALAKGEERPVLSERDVPPRCATCGHPLAEGSRVCPFCLNKGKAVSRMLKYALPYRLPLIAAAGLLVLTTLIELVPPYLTKLIIDDVLAAEGGKGSVLLAILLGLGATTLLMTFMSTVRGYIGMWVGTKVMGDIRRDVFGALMKLSLAYFDRRQTSQFIGRVNSDAESMRQFMTDGVVYVLGESLRVVFIFIVMCALDWQLSLLALLPVPVIVAVSMTLWPKISRRMYQQWRSIYRLNTLVGESLQGIRVVKAFGREPEEVSRYDGVNADVVRVNLRTERLWQIIFPAFGFIAGLGTLLIWYAGGFKVLRGELELGVVLAMIAYLGMLFRPLQSVSQMINWVSSAIVSAHRVFEILDTPSEVPDARDPAPIGSLKGDVEFRGVTYGYEKHHPVIKGVDLRVRAGEMIGLVGHSGAGKSTFINLLCRFYDTDEGDILIDGVPIRGIGQSDLRRQIGVVLQETFLFDGTIAENIAYSKPDATPEEIMRAAKIANAHDFIVRLPDGYDTKVGERGHKLSGGEKQRVAIARAIIHDPRILILDEATASVDTETERQIQEAISRLVQGRTTFAIAHRLSTLRNADRLVVLDRGRIVEVGTHEELLAKEDGVYRKLVDAQTELSKIKGVEGG
ncbi:ATP-binding cassette domain-containing protein [Cohnella xylanilytica]|uniref:ATP-binding cassette domain-containing protein n=1 Tax=Cohnella xylanilytica TaxID=557555 RepID=A0A841TV41_9BACL|nr:ABC transporter ATP-binding protein [Cohnella xylanilytica]MBB6692045.1 ATP-binding cassette domain-containing protein [Cohnella xylanilytica]